MEESARVAAELLADAEQYDRSIGSEENEGESVDELEYSQRTTYAREIKRERVAVSTRLYCVRYVLSM